MKIIRTNSENKDFIKLVKELDAFLKITDEDEHDFYNQFNNIAVLKEVVVVYLDDKPIGCGAIKYFNDTAIEIKRMYVIKENRGAGAALKVITALELWAKELGAKKCILETGRRQVEALRFYQKSDYKVTLNYGQYKGVENSICFEKKFINEL
jgi:putative acetyltransferase